jgi:carboxyl-terminal processing protease
MNFQYRKQGFLFIGIPAIVVAFLLGAYVGNKDHAGSVADFRLTNTALVDQDQFDAFWKAWNILDEKYVEAASTTAEARVWGSIKGLAASYGDPYTVFFPPVESKSFQEDIAGNFEGVGMEIGIKDNQLQVVTPIKDSPAEKAGVKAGDMIIKIGEKATNDMAVDQAVKLIRGAAGTSVKITFLPKGASKTVERTLIRQVINIPTIETSTKPGGIFVIRLYSFSAQSANLFRGALREFVLSGNNKLILDLRGNPGGYLDAAWDIASWFLPAGQTVVIEDFGKNAEQKIYRSKGYNIFTNKLRMIILADGGSASASEILAGALQEHKIAKIVGTETFGKGSVQELVGITSNTSLKVTIARWLTPLGHNLSHAGLKPDYEVKISEKDVAAKNDVQLNKAIELLSN